LFPFSEGRKFDQDFLQSLKPALVVDLTWHILAALQGLAIRFSNSCYFFSQLCYVTEFVKKLGVKHHLRGSH
jgi:hypothetical protein